MPRIQHAALIAAALLGLAAPASGSGFLAARFGGEQGTVTTDDATAMYYNPAGLTLKRGRLRIYLNGVFAWRSAGYDRPQAAIDNILPAGMAGTGTPTEAISANSGKATLLNFIASPFAAVTSDLGTENATIGIGFYAPFGGQASWNTNPAYKDSATYPGAVDGVQRWATTDGIIRSLYFTGAGAYRIPKLRLSLGAGVNVVLNSISTLRARNASGTDDLVNSSGLPQEGRSLLDASGVTASIGVGLMWSPTDNSWIGLSYQSQPNFGEQTLKGTLENKLGATSVSKQDIEIKQSLPDIIRFGGRWRPSKRSELRLAFEYVRWSVFNRQCVLDAADMARNCQIVSTGPMAGSVDKAAGGAGVILNIDRGWKDAMGFRVGGSVWPTERVEVFGGLGYDGNAVPDASLEPSLMDMDKLTFSLGTRIDVFKHMQLGATYTQVYYFDRTIQPRPHDMAGKPISLAAPSKSPDSAGTYSQTIGLLSFHLEFMF